MSLKECTMRNQCGYLNVVLVKLLRALTPLQSRAKRSGKFNRIDQDLK